MLNIWIGDYQVTSDPMNIIVHHKREKTEKKGEEIVGTGEYAMKFIGYYPTFQRACKALIDQEINLSDAENLAEIVAVISNYKKRVDEAVKHIDNDFIKQRQKKPRKAVENADTDPQAVQA